MNSDNDLTILLPVYNPGDGWESRFISMLDNLSDDCSGIDFLVTVVNDGSTIKLDRFFKEEILPFRSNIRYISYKDNKGKGYALRRGMEDTSTEFIIYTDFDFAYGTGQIRQVYNILTERKANLVLGTRGFSYLRELPVKRFALSSILMVANGIQTRFRIYDTQAGLKGLDARAREIFLTTTSNGFIFEVEFIRKCMMKGLILHCLPVSILPGTEFSRFSNKTLKREIRDYFNIMVNGHS